MDFIRAAVVVDDTWRSTRNANIFIRYYPLISKIREEYSDRIKEVHIELECWRYFNSFNMFVIKNRTLYLYIVLTVTYHCDYRNTLYYFPQIYEWKWQRTIIKNIKRKKMTKRETTESITEIIFVNKIIVNLDLVK